MDEDEVMDLAHRAQELGEFFENVRVTFSSDIDADVDAKLKQAVSQFEALGRDLNRVLEGEANLVEAKRELVIAHDNGVKAISLVEQIIESEVKTVVSEIEDLE